MRDHADIEELLALEALGGIEPADRERLADLMAEHGPGCAECADLQRGYGATAAVLGDDLVASSVSEDLEAGTVAAALAEPRLGAAGGRRGWRMTLIAVAAAFALVAIGAIGGYLAAPRGGVDAFLRQPGVRLVPFEPTAEGSGTMTLAVSSSGTEGYVIGTDLAQPPAGQVYELWTISGEHPTSLGCSVPSNGHMAVPVRGDFSSADVAAMTVESDSCPAAPTTAPLQVATLR